MGGDGKGEIGNLKRKARVEDRNPKSEIRKKAEIRRPKNFTQVSGSIKKQGKAAVVVGTGGNAGATAAAATKAGGFRVRAGQREFERGVERHRLSGLLARRQYGKTTIASRIALKKMMKAAGHTVIFGSVKLDLGREMVRKESDAMQRAFQLLAEQAADRRGHPRVGVGVHDRDGGRGGGRGGHRGRGRRRGGSGPGGGRRR